MPNFSLFIFTGEEESGQVSVVRTVQHNKEVSSVSVGEVGEVSNSAVPQALPHFPLTGDEIRQWAVIRDHFHWIL